VTTVDTDLNAHWSSQSWQWPWWVIACTLTRVTKQYPLASLSSPVDWPGHNGQPRAEEGLPRRNSTVWLQVATIAVEAGATVHSLKS